MNAINQMIDLTGKTVIVTGGSSGIGEGCVRVFAEANANVAFCARGRSRGEELLNKLRSCGSGKHSFWVCDVSRHLEIEEMVNNVHKKYGRIDCLINNAGYHPPHNPIDAFSVEYFREIVDMNLTSAFAACKYSLPYIREAHGAIINIGSLVGSVGQEWASVYCATKAGIVGLTKALAIDEARYNVRVNVVLPGNIVTDNRKKFVSESTDPEGLDKLIDSWQWAARSGEIEETGRVCLFLASDLSSYMTGCELILSGGTELGYGVKHPPMFN